MNLIKASITIAILLVVGHVFLFLYGLTLPDRTHLSNTDVVHMILMGSPLLGAIALDAFRYVMNIRTTATTETLHIAAFGLTILIVLSFIGALAYFYIFAAKNAEFDADSLKVYVGATETVLGAYFGIIRSTLFPMSSPNDGGEGQ